MINNQAQLESAINYKFNDVNKLKEALTHPSMTVKKKSNVLINYERFEILGDSLLGFIITEMLFYKFPNYKESYIAKYKAHLVSKIILHKVAQDINLQNHILMTKGEENDGGRENVNNMENALEALIGAIYLDNNNYDNIKDIVHKLWSKYVNNIDLTKIDPKTSLQEWSQANNYGLPIYEVISKKGLTHSPKFIVQVTVGQHSAKGQDTSIKKAEKIAAMKFLCQQNLA